MKSTNNPSKIKNSQNNSEKDDGTSIEDYYNFIEQNDQLINKYKKDIKDEEDEIKSGKKNSFIFVDKTQDMITQVDSMIKEIRDLQSKLNEFKLSNKIKTKFDHIKEEEGCPKQEKEFLNKIGNNIKNIKDEDNKKFNEYKKFIISKENSKEQDYKNIIDKLHKQEEQYRKFKEREKLEKESKENICLNSNDYICGDENMDKLFDEIKMADKKMDNYLKDIDECIELNQNIENQLDDENTDKQKNYFQLINKFIFYSNLDNDKL